MLMLISGTCDSSGLCVTRLTGLRRAGRHKSQVKGLPQQILLFVAALDKPDTHLFILSSAV